MKKLFFLSVLTAITLSACGMNNNNNLDDTALRNQDVSDPIRVNNRNRHTDTNNLADREPLLRVRDNARNVNETPKMRLADQAADKIASMPEVEQVSVIVSNDNAYVAAELSNGVELTKKVEQKIADQVKSVDQQIDDVYVSANPDFYNRMATYSNHIRNGEPIEGFFEGFADTVRRVFPTNTNNNR
ncbi:YhcN/YlaJ family sporulation lipoprotein [Cytobacillus eiseniae]|uniref:YhcN/YlaJ family sporulation lipoprotein n=1 Tax=Cytobacillus eiseniae TaxID=762947 RepID=A0ABS4RA18_9BACI|nr:YhcN/YlaJ family sporulation lipoprotein [Cytobacillus eiseniae]MBP2239743.1 YhcN/YlaJ family sporulation lipoprotein [Cytobacillus eiseniae]